ncbi:dimethylsulfonioproprionate lyase family protein [Dongia sp.]|uniref:dimethylsulfonioproprionate lyase family protein n=1 Tax=Dongia sp. TaxID=1977262 RepID=UPI0035AF6AF7
MQPLDPLWHEIDGFLATLPDAEGGVARTRHRMAEMAGLRKLPGNMPPAPPRCGHYSQALAAAEAGPAAGIVRILGGIDLHWTSYDAYAADTIGPLFPRRHAYTSLIAAADPDWGQDFDLGFLLIAPGTLYRDHHHLASELYVPLTGPSSWRFGTTAPWQEKVPGDIVWNPPQRVHATLVRDMPLLCLYAWTENVHAPAVVDFSDDWQRLEAALIA